MAENKLQLILHTAKMKSSPKCEKVISLFCQKVVYQTSSVRVVSCNNVVSHCIGFVRNFRKIRRYCIDNSAHFQMSAKVHILLTTLLL